MAELVPAPFPHLLRRMLREAEREQKIFDLPARRFWRGPDDLDTSAVVHGHRAANPVGPAAGPHGPDGPERPAVVARGRALHRAEDGAGRTTASRSRGPVSTCRPWATTWSGARSCVWPRPARVRQGLDARSTSRGPWGCSAGRTTPPATNDPRPERGLRPRRRPLARGALLDRVDEGRAGRGRGPAARDPGRARRLRDLDFRSALSGQVTLSTFHGCPANEIEAMAVFLMEEVGLHVTVKLNPTLLGKDAVDGLLHDVLGYRTSRRGPRTSRGPALGQAFEMTDRLAERGAALGRELRLKLSNTLVVRNHRRSSRRRSGDVPLGPPAPRDYPGPRRALSSRAARRAAVLLRRGRQPQLRRLRGPRPRSGDRLQRPPQAGRLLPPAEVPREPRGAHAGPRRPERWGTSW